MEDAQGAAGGSSASEILKRRHARPRARRDDRESVKLTTPVGLFFRARAAHQEARRSERERDVYDFARDPSEGASELGAKDVG